jgi:predicted RNA binding protein YcfA (HicA-like mRNA interferase family)
MPKGYYRDLVKELKKLGYVYVGQAKGSHEKWQRPGDEDVLIVPFNINSRHTANDVLKDAGTAKKF